MSALLRSTAGSILASPYASHDAGGDRTLSLPATCSHCAYTRRFAAELGGKFYRCPKCRKGVISVPKAPPGPHQASSAAFERDLARHVEQHRRRVRQHAETEENTLIGDTALASQLREEEAEGTLIDPEGPAGAAAAAAEAAAADVGKQAPAPSAARPENRGQIATARRILVECGLCGFLVQIPAELFGKTVHCPECAGNTIFTESTLDPVKEELLDRLALETGERRALFPPTPAPGGPGWVTRNALQSFLIGVGLGLVVLALGGGVLRWREGARRDAAVERALGEGWRYATAPGAALAHEPWCPQLDPSQPGRRLTRAELEASPELTLHECGE